MLDQLKKIYALLKDLFLSMTPGNRVVAVMLMSMLLFSLGYLIIGSIKTGESGKNVVKIYDGLRFDPNEKRAAENALSNAGKTDYLWLGDQLQVPARKIAEYTALLAAANVVQKTGSAVQDTADNLSAWQSGKMMDTKMIAAKTKLCADAIKKMSGIADAMVISNKRPDWNRNVWARTEVFSAAVTVEAIQNKPLSDNTISAIANIVAPAFGILDMKKNLTIVDSKNNRAYNGLGEEVSSAQGEYIRHQKKFQDEFNDRLYGFLPSIDGLKIETSVELTSYRSEEEFRVEHDKPTVLVNHTMDYQFHKEGYDRFSRPGAIAQFNRPLIDPSASTNAKDLTDEKKNEKETTNALPGREVKSEQLPYIPLRVFASIQVPRGHLRDIWIAKNKGTGETTPEPTAEQLQAEQEQFTQETKQSVSQLLRPFIRDRKTDPLTLVEVNYYNEKKPEIKELTAWEQIQLFLQNNWQTLSLLGLVFCGMTVLYALTKSPKPEPIVIYEGLETPLEAIDARLKAKAEAEAQAQAEAEAAQADIEAEIDRTLDSFGSIRSLKDEIAELIAENPEAAAAVVRQWIGNAVLLETKT